VRIPKFFPQLTPLGSGSDYTAFLDHLGVPAVDMNFGGKYGVYHSIFDNFFWMEKFCDPDFTVHTMAARLYTLYAMRAASADAVPLTFSPYALAIRDQVDDLRKRLARKNLDDKPDREFPRLAELVKSIRAFQEQAESLDAATTALTEQKAPKSDEQLHKLNTELIHVERAFLSADGLPGRPWFKHTIYAPGLTTGYASWPLPGLRGAIEDDDAKILDAQVRLLIERIDAATATMKRAEGAARN
jgi:N-acetylated-alpha-linked acidic dipeptidase